MIKKKLLVVLFTIAIILGLGNVVNAFTVSAPPFPHDWGDGWILYCREKGGAFRIGVPNTGRIEEFYYPSACPRGSVWNNYLMGVRSKLAGRIEFWLNAIAETEKAIPTSAWDGMYNGNNGELHYTPMVTQDGTVWRGACIATMPDYEVISETIDKNRTYAYILSAGEEGSPLFDGHEQGNYIEGGTISDNSSPEDQQEAIWNDPTINQGTMHYGSSLYQESVDYQNFIESTNIINNEYDAKFSKINEAQVTVDRGASSYTVGPFIMNYPDDNRFSYIENMKVIANNGTEYKLNPATDILFGSKGSRVYPGDGEEFYIQFTQGSIGNATSVDLQVQFTYLAETTAEIRWLKGKGEIWQYIGQIEWVNGDWHTDGHNETDYSRPEEDDEGNVTYPHDKWVDTSHQDYKIGAYITMEKIDEYESQLLMIARGDRIWKSVYLSYGINLPSETPPAFPPADKQIFLTIEVGGKVFVDKDGGKESISDGLYGSGDELVANIEVTLYEANGALATVSACADPKCKNYGKGGQNPVTTDSNGQYVFCGLDAMKQYYVRFKYNGQYYEATTYSSPSATYANGSSTWQNNSNGTENRSDRLALNEKFQTIGATPNNYSGGQTYTRDQLSSAGAIDAHGNLAGGSASMQNFVNDCMIYSYSGNGSMDLYPLENSFVIDYNQYPSVLVPTAQPLYDKMYYINQGLKERQEVDLALKKDVEKATLEINGKTHVYEYDKRSEANDPNYDGTFDIGVRISDGYYSTEYSRELYKSDYAYKVSQYGENYAEYGKDKDDELKIFVTYKITVRNQSMSIRGRIDEIVDYFDKDYTFVPERSYIEWSDRSTNNNPDIFSVGSSKLGSTPGDIEGYNKVYVTGGDRYLNAGEKVTYYLTYEVNKTTDSNGENWIILDEELESGAAIGVGKENIAEINRYSTIYANGTQVPNVGDVGGLAAGLVDRDSNPGNVEDTGIGKDTGINDAIYERFEDDSDKAPNIRIILYRDDEENRVIQGTVWEDERNVNDNSINKGTTATGDGIRDEGETKINGVTVQLVEIMDNGTEFVWREYGDHSQDYTKPIETIGKGTGSGTQVEETPIINVANLVANYKFTGDYAGQYVFKSFMPGNYVVRYIYGDTIRTVLVNDTSESEEAKNISRVYGEKGLNAKSYNGQDYKSTTYQAGLGTYNGNNTHAGYVYDIGKSDATGVVSDAKDLKTLENIRTTMSQLNSRAEVIDYSNDNLINHIAEVLASYREQPSYNGNAYNQTQVQSLVQELINETKMTAETGSMNIEFEYNTGVTGNNGNNNQTRYVVANVDLGLEERPKSQLAIEKEVTNVKLTLANGTVLFDAETTASNVLWQDHKNYQAGYKNGLLDGSKFSTITAIRNMNSTKFGLIQLTMDEELMHGATIRISYQITVRNVGEADYNDDNFYYTGVASNTDSIVKTTANQVIDYIANNLQFYVADNSSWQVISQEELINKGLVNTALKDNIAQYNTIITTTENANIAKTALVPTIYKDKINKDAQDSVSDPLVLTQLITAENDTDDLTYRNIVEIVKTSNTVGRKNEYSVVGNQDPSKEPQEMDSDRSETVRILPPFGDTGIYYIIAITIIAGVGIIIIGIIFIKRKVLRK